jgi:hypothetical protein
MKCRPLNVIGYMRLFGFLWKEVTNAKSFNSAQFPSPHQLNAITDSKTHNTALINYNTKEKQTNKQTKLMQYMKLKHYLKVRVQQATTQMIYHSTSPCVLLKP